MLGRRRRGDPGWTARNDVRPLVHGSAYFAALAEAVEAQVDGDVLLFTDWRGDPDERLAAGDDTVGGLLCRAAERG